MLASTHVEFNLFTEEVLCIAAELQLFIMVMAGIHEEGITHVPALLKLKRKSTNSCCEVCCSFRVELVLGSSYPSETLMIVSVGLVAS